MLKLYDAQLLSILINVYLHMKLVMFGMPCGNHVWYASLLTCRVLIQRVRYAIIKCYNATLHDFGTEDIAVVM